MVDAYGRQQQAKTEDEQVGPEEVVIVIKGPRAARMIGAAGSEARIKDEIVRAVGEKLESMEAAAAKRAEEHARLTQLVKQLYDQSTHASNDAARLREEVKRLRDELTDYTYRFRHLQEEVRSLATPPPPAEPPPADIPHTDTAQAADSAGHGGDSSPGGSAPHPRSNGVDTSQPTHSNGAAGSWFGRRTFALWTAAAAVALGAALWIYV